MSPMRKKEFRIEWEREVIVSEKNEKIMDRI